MRKQESMRRTKPAVVEIELDLGRYELRRHGRRIKLEKKPMELLIFLVARRDSWFRVRKSSRNCGARISLSIRSRISTTSSGKSVRLWVTTPANRAFWKPWGQRVPIHWTRACD